METSSQPLDSVYVATLEEWGTFLKSRVWKDFETYISDSIEDGKDLLTMGPSERSVAVSDETLRGGIAMLRRVFDFPHIQVRELELEQE